MTDFLKILESKMDLSPTEVSVAEKWFVQVERDNRYVNQISSGGGGGYVTSLEAGNVAIDLSEGITLRNPGTGDRTVRLDPDGDAWFGHNIDDPDFTTMFIISNQNNYNGETFGAGDLLIGSNSAGKGNMWWDASAGKLFFRSGTTQSVEIGDGGIVASWGTIGGWEITATAIQKTGLAGDIYLHGLTDTTPYIELRGGAGSAKILLHPDYIASGSFSSGASGFMIESATGDAEFNNLVARGKIVTAVFEKDTVSAVGGYVSISKNAGTVAVPFITGTAVDVGVSFSMDDSVQGDQVAEVDDVLAMRAWNGDAVVACYLTVTAIGATSGGVTEYTVDYEYGNDDSLFSPGTAVLNMGPSGAGILALSAGETTTKLSIYTHAGSPWTSLTTHVVLGNMRGTYDTGANDRYGIGIGDHSSGNYLSYNAETENQFMLSAGAGAIAINEDGILMSTGVDPEVMDETDIQWTNGGWRKGLIGGYGSDGENSTIAMMQWADENKSANIRIQAWTRDSPMLPAFYVTRFDLFSDYNASQQRWARIAGAPLWLVVAGGGGGLTVPSRGAGGDLIAEGSIVVGADAPGYTLHEGHIHLDSGTSSYGMLQSPGHFFMTANGQFDGSTWRTIQTGAVGNLYLSYSTGMYFRTAASASAGSARTLTTLWQVDQTGKVWQEEGLSIHGTTSGVDSRAGLELEWDGTRGDILAYDRDTSAYQPLRLRGSAITFLEASTTRLTIDNADVYTEAWTNYAPTIVGWGSYTVNTCRYRRIGKMMFVSFSIDGTSNSSTTTISLPAANQNITNHHTWYATVVYNNGAYENAGHCLMTAGAATLSFYRAGAATYTASGRKIIRFSMSYMMA